MASLSFTILTTMKGTLTPKTMGLTLQHKRTIERYIGPFGGHTSLNYPFLIKHYDQPVQPLRQQSQPQWTSADRQQS